MDEWTFEYNAALLVDRPVQERLYRSAWDVFGMTQAQLASQDRTRTPSLARQAIVLTLRHWDRSITLMQLAAAMYRGDHTTARYALEHGQEEYQKVATFAAQVDLMKARVGVRGMMTRPPEDTEGLVVYLQSENKRLQGQIDAMAAVLADLQGRIAFVNVQYLPSLVRARAVGSSQEGGQE